MSHLYCEKYRIRGDRGSYTIFDTILEETVPGISIELGKENDRKAFQWAIQQCRQMNLDYTDRVLYLEEIYDYIGIRKSRWKPIELKRTVHRD